MGTDESRKFQLYEQISRSAKALAHGKRLELLDLLAQGERTVDALSRAVGTGVTSTSAHLQILKQGGLVATRRDGTRIYYRLAGDDVAVLFLQLRQVAAGRLADVAAAARAYLGPDTTEVTRDGLVERAATGEIMILDVRPVEEYDAGHIPGARNIPLAELAARIRELPAGVEIVAYCRGPLCVLAPDAVRLLTDHGLPASRLADGMPEWRLAGLPVQTARA